MEESGPRGTGGGELGRICAEVRRRDLLANVGQRPRLEGRGEDAWRRAPGEGEDAIGRLV